MLEIAGQKKGLLLLAGLLSVGSAMCMLVPYWAVYEVLKELLLHGSNPVLANGTEMIRWGWIALGGLVGGLVLLYAALMSSHVAAFRILYGLRVRLSEHIGKLPLGYLNNTSIGSIKNDGSEYREDRGIHCTYYPRFGKCDSYGGSDVCHFLLIKCMVDSGVFDSCRIKPFPAIFQFYGKESEGVYACLLRCTGKDEYFCCTICSWNAYSKDFWAKCILVPPVQCRDTGIQDICFEML